MGEEEDDRFCCSPTKEGFLSSVACCLGTSVLAVGLLCLQKVVDFKLTQGNFVDGRCQLTNEEFREGAEQCVGTLAATYRAVSCAVGINVTRNGLRVQVPTEVSLLFRLEEGGCANFRRLREAYAAGVHGPPLSLLELPEEDLGGGEAGVGRRQAAAATEGPAMAPAFAGGGAARRTPEPALAREAERDEENRSSRGPRRRRGRSKAIRGERGAAAAAVSHDAAGAGASARRTMGACDQFVPAHLNRQFDCSFLLSKDTFELRLRGSEVIALNAEDMRLESTGYLLGGLIALNLMCFCFLAGLCLYVTKSMA